MKEAPAQAAPVAMVGRPSGVFSDYLALTKPRVAALLDGAEPPP